MELFKKLEKYAKNTLKEASTYADQYLLFKSDMNTELSNLMLNLANIHIDIYNKIHQAMVNTINDYKRTHGDAPGNMKVIYDYIHEQEVEWMQDIKSKLK